MALGGVGAAVSTAFGLYAFESMAQRWGWQWPVAIILAWLGITALVCFDLSRKLSLKTVVAFGFTGWLLNFALLAFELHRQGWWP